MLPRLFLFAGLLLGLARPARPQAAPVAGRVLDDATHRPVPYAALALPAGGRGTVADSTGRFVLAGWVGGGPDSLVVTTPGYRRQALARPPAAQPLTVALVPVPVPAAPYLSTACGSLLVKVVGCRARKPGDGRLVGAAGSQHALFIASPPRSRAVRAVFFFLKTAGWPYAHLRVRLSRADGAGGAPGSDLLADNVVVPATGREWRFGVDLSSFNVQVPEQGFYLTLEWLAGAGQLPGLPASPATDALSSPVLSPTLDDNGSRAWHYLPGQGWQRVVLRNRKDKTLNAMMKAEIDVYQ